MELSIPCCSALKIAPLSSSGCRLKLPASYLHFSNASLKFPSAAIRRRRHFILACSKVDAAGTGPQLNKVLQFRDAFWRFLRPHTIRGTTLGSL